MRICVIIDYYLQQRYNKMFLHGSSGHHSLCIQSMDGMLMFFEQDSYSFGRFLPGFLLPGPLVYNSRTDSFLTVSSVRQLESYKYETLAVATEAENRQDPDLPLKTGGKRLTPDWTFVLGEQALDLSVPSFSHSSSAVFVLGERNLYCLRDNGQLRFMKKLEFNPSCFFPYASVMNGTTNLLLANHTNMLLIYQDVTLKWAAQLSFVPVAMRVANFPDLKGVVVSLSSDGHLLCSYMGTDPSFFSTPKVDAREADYEQVDAEMKKLQKIIREATRTQDILPKTDSEEDLIVTAVVSSSMDSPSEALIQDIDGLPVPSVTIQVKVKASCVVQSSKLTISVQPPLAVSQDQFVLEPIGVGSSTVVAFSAFLNGRYPPADLTGDISVSYNSPTGVPRVLQSRFSLPLALVCVPSFPAKTTKFKITVDTNQPPVDIKSIFPEFSAKSEDKDGNSLAFQFLSGAKVTVLASKTSQRYRIQSDSFEDMWLVVKELVQRFNQHFSKLGVKDFKKSFSGPLPLQEYFLSVDHHFQLRVSAQQYQDLLSERAVQFRAIQRRLLTRFKDKTPAPLQNLDTLLDATYSQVMTLAEAAEETRAQLEEAFVRLRSATHLLVLLLSLWQSLTPDQTAILEATLLPLLQDTPQLGWEESCDAAVSHLLRTCLSRSPKDQATTLAQAGGLVLGLPRDTVRLKKHITLLCDRIAKGGRLTLASEANVQIPAQVQSLAAPGGVEPIAEMAGDGEELGLPQEVTKFIKKKQPSKKVKKDKDSKDKKEVSKEPSEASVKEEAGDTEESISRAKKESSSKEKKESKKDSSKEESKKESKKESSSSKEKKESSKEKKERDKNKEEKEASKESGDKKVSRKSSLKVKEKKKEAAEAGDG
ncbi:protein PTHB1 [Anabas testudineus]|uniref:protein PTHB1 n=1 Tax=Anabas testudineus TaxID=64144 RepID=UPI000E4661C6|nr:protein PTHB1 [Anabas testudineus]